MEDGLGLTSETSLLAIVTTLTCEIEVKEISAVQQYSNPGR